MSTTVAAARIATATVTSAGGATLSTFPPPPPLLLQLEPQFRQQEPAQRTVQPHALVLPHMAPDLLHLHFCSPFVFMPHARKFHRFR